MMVRTKKGISPGAFSRIVRGRPLPSFSFVNGFKLSRTILNFFQPQLSGTQGDLHFASSHSPLFLLLRTIEKGYIILLTMVIGTLKLAPKCQM